MLLLCHPVTPTTSSVLSAPCKYGPLRGCTSHHAVPHTVPQDRWEACKTENITWKYFYEQHQVLYRELVWSCSSVPLCHPFLVCTTLVCVRWCVDRTATCARYFRHSKPVTVGWRRPYTVTHTTHTVFEEDELRTRFDLQVRAIFCAHLGDIPDPNPYKIPDATTTTISVYPSVKRRGAIPPTWSPPPFVGTL